MWEVVEEKKGITVIRTARSLMFLDNKNNDGLGEVFNGKKITC